MATTTVIQKTIPFKTHPMSPKTNTITKTRFRIDSKRPLEPARKKLNTIETQRVMSVLLDGIKRVQFASILPEIIQNIDRHKISLGTEVKMLEKHMVISESYHELKSKVKKGNSSPTSRISSAENINRNLNLVIKQVDFSLKNILRSFSLNSNLMNSLLEEYLSNSTKVSNDFISDVEQLKDILMGMLLTTPVEEADKMHYVKLISERERQNASIVQTLEGELNVDVNQMEEEISEKNENIRGIQKLIHDVTKRSEDNIERIKTDTEKQILNHKSNSENKVQKLQYDIGQQKMQLQNMISEHRESEMIMRKKKYKIETEVENWIQKYDQDMGERHAEYEEIDAMYTEEKKQLNELEVRFKTLEEEYNKIMEERQIAREKKEAAQRQLEMATTAATCIQSVWRSFKVRKAIKASKKKKTTKKGK